MLAAQEDHRRVAASDAAGPLGAFTVRADPGCQRGLHLLYRVPSHTDLEQLQALLEQAHPGRLLVVDEPWGRRRVRRVVLQFRFEVRLGVRDDQISFFFRATSPAPARASDRTAFEAALTLAIPSEAAP
jgi:hypothetical protein